MGADRALEGVSLSPPVAVATPRARLRVDIVG